MRPTTVTSLEPYEDANGNHIDYDGPDYHPSRSRFAKKMPYYR